jgi:hypothetical protein
MRRLVSLLMLVRTVVLAVIDTKRPELCPRFFEDDLAPCILEFLRRDDGGCCSELMKGADCTLYTVHLWFTSVLPLLLAVECIPVARSSNRPFDVPGGIFDQPLLVVPKPNNDGPAQLMLGISMAVFLFCLHGLRVLWPKSFQGELPYRLL